MLLAAAALLVASGCDEGSEAPSHRASGPPTRGQRAVSTTTTETASATPSSGAPTPAELRWAGQVARWTAQLGRALLAVGGAKDPDAPGVAAALTLWRGCADSLDALGPPPNEQLTDIKRKLEEACAHIARSAELVPSALADPDSDAAASSETELKAVLPAFLALPDDLDDFMPGGGRALPVVTGALDAKTSRVDSGLGEIASLVAEQDIEVRCWSREDWRAVRSEGELFTGEPVGIETAGLVTRPGVVNLDPTICRDLVRLKWGACGSAFCHEDYRPRALRPKLRVAEAAVIFAHEIEHAIGVANEAAAQCFGMQEAEFVARTLGAEQRYAASLAQAYYVYVYPTLPDEYRTAACRPGGRLDLNPDFPDWP
jgi:hypothetical protein